MKPLDFAKAFGLGALALALNLGLLFLLVYLYSQFIAPGRPPAHYNAVAPRIGAWSAPLAAPALMFLIVWAFSRRRPQRNAYGFGLAVLVSYAAIDGGLGLASGPVAALLQPPFLLGMTGGLLAALAAAALSARRAG